MKKISQKVMLAVLAVGLFSGLTTAFAQEWSTTYPTYDTGSWSTTYPTYDTGSWSTTYPTYDTGSWSTTYPTYDTGSWSTTYPTYDTGSWSTTYPTYDTGSWSTTYPTYDTGSWSTTYPTYDTGDWSTTYPTYDTGTTYPTYDTGSVNYGYTNYGYTNYGSTNYGYTNDTSFSGYNYGPGYTYPNQPIYTPVNPVVPVTPIAVCSDGLAPVNGTCVRTNTIPVVNTTICSDGHAPVNGTCVRTNTIPVINTTICADGLAPVNGSCIRTNTVPVINTTICADGSYPVNGTCVRTNTLPVINNTICSDGSYPVNGSCVRTVVAPTVTYQTCWDGSVLPLYSVCPAQYKTCPNGTSVPVNQACYYNPAPTPYVPPVVIKFNNVITSVATEITLSSARCNGIGLIASNAPSTGWFEYGETANLGRETAKASIGSSATAPFSNVLANLKPSTTYYCRAVMNNQFGTVKGEIVAFKTKAKAVVYVKPVTQTTTKKTVTTKTVAKKNEIVCSDGTTVSTGSKSSADLINNGQKLVSLQMEKVSGTLAPGSVVNYKLVFKNLSNDTLRGMTVKVTIPGEITLMQATSGTYDPATRTLTATVPSLAAGAEGFVGWTGSIASSTQAGRSVAMTGYANYTVPGTDVQDEVTAYTVGQIVPATDGGATTTGAKKVVGASSDRGFLPNSLVEWLALIAIIFIIFILARSVYTSYREEKVIVRE